MKDKTYWVYILRCEGHKYYTGFTNNLQKRYESHLNGKGKCKFTRSFKPQSIAQSWQINSSKGDALKVERYIKSLSRTEKEKLIHSPELLLSIFESYIGS